MTTHYMNFSPYNHINLSESISDITFFLDEYKERIQDQLQFVEDNNFIENPFISFANKSLSLKNFTWLKDNDERFFRGTANDSLITQDFLSSCGFICCMIYSRDGESIIVGHSSGLIQMRHGSTGTVLSTLRHIQFPPKPIYALKYSTRNANICYASCMDGNVYKIEIPQIPASVDNPPKYCIRADPAIHSLNTQFYGAPGIASNATPFVTQRSPALCLGLTADHTKMVVGYADTGIRAYDMETQQVALTYIVHKLRIPYIPPNLQRMHFGQVCALQCHAQKPYMFASGSWDKTLRIWDIRCKVGCVMTFEGVDICSDSIDLHRDQCITGSWQTTEALTVWDLVAKKKVCIVRVQNRRHDVDGEYIYACRYWHSTDFNRKGKYAIIGGSGTNSVEVINIHNRYITCSYPASGTVLAIASHQDRIAFGGTSTSFNIVKFHDPKHEKDKYQKDDELDLHYIKSNFDDTDSDKGSVCSSNFVSKSSTRNK